MTAPQRYANKANMFAGRWRACWLRVQVPSKSRHGPSCQTAFLHRLDRFHHSLYCCILVVSDMLHGHPAVLRTCCPPTFPYLPPRSLSTQGSVMKVLCKQACTDQFMACCAARMRSKLNRLFIACAGQFALNNAWQRLPAYLRATRAFIPKARMLLCLGSCGYEIDSVRF